MKSPEEFGQLSSALVGAVTASDHRGFRILTEDLSREELLRALEAAIRWGVLLMIRQGSSEADVISQARELSLQAALGREETR